ncbi:MAG: hypothetical protein ACRDTN_09925, partial [Mycobacterium sp.]
AVFPAQATPEEVALNGTYRATSDGEWAKLNHQMHGMETVTSIWTVSTTCTSSKECTGQVSTDQGWSAAITLNERYWLVTHEVEGYARCSDGTTVAGHRHYKFSQQNRDNIYSKVGVGDLQGYETTLGPSGACGNNEWLYVEMPFTLVRIG